MNILFVDEKDWGKKVPYTIHYLAEQLVARGHRVFAVDFDDTWRRENPRDFWSPARRRMLAKLDAANAVDVTSPGFVKLPALARVSTLATHTRAIAGLLRREQIDCIVTYSITNALPTLALGRALGVPVVFHSIDMLAPLVPHRVLERPAELLEAMLMRGCDAVLGLTPTFAERARRLGARETFVIPNGVDVERLRPGLDTQELRAELGLSPEERVLVFVGTLTRHVGLDLLLEQCARAPQPATRVVVVGDDIVGAGRERRRLEARVAELGLGRQVIFAGLQPAARVPLYINLADICLSPFPPSTFSKYNIAMKVFEYMACARPTVTFNLEGTRSLVPAGQGGVLYVESHGEMLAAIAGMLDDPWERRRLGQAGRALVERRFSWQQVGGELERALALLVGRQGRRSRVGRARGAGGISSKERTR
jgi:glycosyltransferase involved in cell wall biosynthesis